MTDVPAGPFETEEDARAARAVRSAYASGDIQAANYAMLDGACASAGVRTGDYDRRILYWLANYEPQMCAVLAGIIHRAAQPPEGTVTEWAIRVADPDSGRTDESMPVASEEVARAAVPAWRRGGWAEVAVVSRRVGPWTEAPEPEDGNDD